MPDQVKDIDIAISSVKSVLLDKKRPLKERYRALFTLKNLAKLSTNKSDEEKENLSVKAISELLLEQMSGENIPENALLKHEGAYCLGQIGDQSAVDTLISVLKNTLEHPMVRHEAGEALGAIGSEKALPVLKDHLKDDIPEISQTCQLAVERIQSIASDPKTGKKLESNQFHSIDPTLPFGESKDVEFLTSLLKNTDETLYKRFAAMFALRNDGSEAAVKSLCETLVSDGEDSECTGNNDAAGGDSLKKGGSALFRHELAFVLGQLQNTLAVDALAKNLSDRNENCMVRHECAEALGAIASPACRKILTNYLDDVEAVVRQSCEVALDMCDYANSSEFQYANTLVRLNENENNSEKSF